MEMKSRCRIWKTAHGWWCIEGEMILGIPMTNARLLLSTWEEAVRFAVRPTLYLRSEMLDAIVGLAK